MQNTKKLSIFVLCILTFILSLSLYGCDISGTKQSYENIAVDEEGFENGYCQTNFDESNWPPKDEEQIIMRVGIFRTETYYFTLSQNGVIEASWGDHTLNTPFEERELYEIVKIPGLGERRRPDARYHHHFEEDLVDMLGVVKEIDTYQLTRNEFDNVIQMLERIKNIPDDRALNAGAFGDEIYTTFLNYNDTFFQFMYRGPALTERDVVEAFVEMLLWHSPVQTPEFWGRRKREIEAGIRPLDRWIRGTPQG